MHSVSVVLPTYNRARTLGRAIDSVLSQTYSDFELIIVDDGSTDDTDQVVQSYKDKRISYFRKDRCGGAAAAYNAGVRKSSHELIAFQDSDDEWVATKLEKQLNALADASSDTGIVYSDMMYIGADGRQHYFTSPVIDSAAIVNPVTREYATANIGSQSCLIRKDLFLQAGLFNEDLPALEDLEFFIRLSRIARFLKVAEPLVLYYEMEGLSSNHQACAKARSMLLSMYGKELSSEKWFIARQLAVIAELKLLWSQKMGALAT